MEPSVSEEELLLRAESSFDRFFQAIDAQFEAESASSEQLQDFASEEVADSFAASIQESLESGVVSRGVPTVTDIELVEQDASSYRVEICADGSAIETLDADGIRKPPAGLVAWSATLPLQSDQPELASLDLLLEDLSICES